VRDGLLAGRPDSVHVPRRPIKFAFYFVVAAFYSVVAFCSAGSSCSGPFLLALGIEGKRAFLAAKNVGTKLRRALKRISRAHPDASPDARNQ
jgi:hypothetical protein